MESKIAPNIDRIIASTEYPLIRIKDIYFSMKYIRRGGTMPIKSEAKGSMITVEEELKNTPVYISY